MKISHCFLLLLVIWGCNNPASKETNEETPESTHKQSFTVEHAGALKNMMHKGDLNAYADLNAFHSTHHFYAIGALEGLKGEILVLDGVPYISSVQENSLKIDDSFDYKASLLVHSQISKWDTTNIDEEVQTYAELEDFVAATAQSEHIDITKPFPFLLEGLADSLSWHVINWPEEDSVHTHEKHIRSGLHGTLQSVEATILGFYSDSHHAVFTHHTTNMHLHFLSNDRSLTGHVDRLVLGKGMKLLLPKVE